MKMKKAMAILSAGVLALSVTACGENNGNQNKYAVVTASYADEKGTQQTQKEDTEDPDDTDEEMKAAEALRSFYLTTASRVLQNADQENQAYSPASVYLALGMLSEISGGDTRTQVLSVLKENSLKALRSQAQSIWAGSFQDDKKKGKCLLADSVWMDQNLQYNGDTLKNLAKYYYASSFCGKMGSADYNKTLHSWIDSHTDNMLQDTVDNLKMADKDILAFVNTIVFQGKWMDPFQSKNTKEDTFYAPDREIKAQFMHESEDGIYYWSDHFSAVSKDMQNGCAMWMFLPDEGVSADMLLKDKNVVRILNSYYTESDAWKKQKYVTVNLALPEFDMTSSIDLKESLRKLGITDAFVPEKADFSPLLTADHKGTPYLSGMEHAVRVIVDEEGAKAAGFTAGFMAGSAAPADDEVDFVLNRPFLYMITDGNGMPLFVGVLNTP